MKNILRYLNFCPEFFGPVEKPLDKKPKKPKVKLKIYNVTTWIKNNYNTHIAMSQEVKRQSDDEIWLVNKM